MSELAIVVPLSMVAVSWGVSIAVYLCSRDSLVEQYATYGSSSEVAGLLPQSLGATVVHSADDVRGVGPMTITGAHKSVFVDVHRPRRNMSL